LDSIRFKSDNFFAAIVSRHSSLKPTSKFDRWSVGSSELNGDQRLNRFDATQIMAEVPVVSNLNLSEFKVKRCWCNVPLVWNVLFVYQCACRLLLAFLTFIFYKVV